jgi:hypothetical protein
MQTGSRYSPIGNPQSVPYSQLPIFTLSQLDGKGNNSKIQPSGMQTTGMEE